MLSIVIMGGLKKRLKSKKVKFWLVGAGLDAGLASGALLSQMRQLATYSRPKGRGRRALKEAWVKSTGGTLGNERGVNRQSFTRSFKSDRSLKKQC